MDRHFRSLILCIEYDNQKALVKGEGEDWPEWERIHASFCDKM